jgi:hypothetical protein
MHARKLTLAVLLGGPILGVLTGLWVDPELQAPPEPPWRKLKPDIIFTGAVPFAYAGPEDLSPPIGREMPSLLLARRFAADAEPPPDPLQWSDHAAEQPAAFAEYDPDAAEREAAPVADAAAMGAGDDAAAAEIAANDVEVALAPDISEGPALPHGTGATADF